MNDSRKNEILIHRILSGKQIFVHENNTYELRKPSLSLKLQADLVYESAYEENIYNNFWFLEDIDNLLFELQLISPDYKNQLTKIEKFLNTNKIALYQNYFDSTKRKKIKQKIQNIKDDLYKIHQKKHSLDFITLEHFCDNIKHEFIIVNTLYYYNTDKLVFNEQAIDTLFFNSVMSLLSSNILDITKYKQLARSDYWKNYWNINKTHIFNEPIIEWSEEQKTLINVSSMYDKIYEHPECPGEDIINDDDALDGWMLFNKQENEKQKKEKGVDNMLSGKIRDSSEIFLMAGSKEQAEDILSLNSNESLNKIKDRMSLATNSSAPIKDSQIPDVKQRIIQQLKDRG